MATFTIGTMQEFQPGSEPITTYLYRTTQGVPGRKRDRRRYVLISTIGHKTYAVLRSLMKRLSHSPKHSTCWNRLLKSTTSPNRWSFRRDIFPTSGGESVAEYVAELRRLAAILAISWMTLYAIASQDDDYFAEADGNTSLAKVAQMDQSYEQAEKNAKALKGPDAAIKKPRWSHL